MRPHMGSEMARARMEEFQEAARRERLARAALRGRRWSARSDPPWRLSLGLGLVRAGFRLMGETTEPGLPRLSWRLRAE